MIHSLGLFEKLDVLRNHKVRALGYLNNGQSVPLNDLYQQRMSGKNMQGNGWCEFNADSFCGLAAEEVYENNISHIVPDNDDTTIENNGYTVKQSVGDSSSIPLLKRGTYMYCS